MQEALVLIFRRSYKPLSVIVLLAAFFVFYNARLVDRSLVNLSVALQQASAAKDIGDLQKIKPYLKVVLLNEISKADTSSLVLTSLESVLNMVDTAKNKEEIEEVKFYLKMVLEEKEKAAGKLKTNLNALNRRLFAPQEKMPLANLNAEADKLTSRIKSEKDKGALQDLYFALGNLYLKIGESAQAEKAFGQAANLDPATALGTKASFNLAWTYKNAGQYEEAINQLLDLRKQFAAGNLQIMSNYQMADIFYKKEDFTKASDTYAEISNEYPEFSLADMALYVAAQIAFYNLNDKERALKYLSALEEKYPKSRFIQHEMSKFRPAIAHNLILEGYEKLREKNYLEAADIFKRANDISPFDGRSGIGGGLADYWLGLKENAIEKAKRAASLSPYSEKVLVNCMFVAINAGALDEATRIGEEALAKTPINLPEFYYNLSYAYLLKAQGPGARKRLEETIKLNPDFVYAYNNLGCSYWTIHNYSEAIKKFQEAIAIDPDFKDAHFNLGVAYLHTNQLQKAYSEFKTVKEKDPNYKDIDKYLKQVTDYLQYQP